MYLPDPDPTAICTDTSTGAGHRERETADGSHHSFLLHIRPKRYPRASIQFRHTFHLGFWTAFLLVVEGITGLLLMFYYIPTPEGAYLSIQRLVAEIPFGRLFRDLHRLTGDLLLVVASLHLLRVALTGSYTGQRRFTWVTGILLLLLLLALAFSGYLLPWDQLSYWAVTVGTSLFQAIPLFGEPLQQMLRGGAEIGADGLLRFYILHVLALPAIAGLFLAIHYYRLVRLHGVSLPLDASFRPAAMDMKSVPLWPEVASREMVLILFGLIVLLAIASFAYDAPLGARANPLHTPSHTQAPWFFLWIQGLLTLGATTLTGIVLPLALLLALLFLPYFDQGQRRPLRRRPKMLAALAATGVFLIACSFLGGQGANPRTRSPETILNSFMPRDDTGPFSVLSYERLAAGVYPLLRERSGKDIPVDLAPLIGALDRELRQGAAERQFADTTGVLIVEPWQDRLKRITLRFTCLLPGNPARQTFERMVYRHGFGPPAHPSNTVQ